MGYLDPKRMKGNKNSGMFLAALYGVCTVAVFVFLGITAYRVVNARFIDSGGFSREPGMELSSSGADVIQKDDKEGSMNEAKTEIDEIQESQESVQDEEKTEKKSKKEKSKKNSDGYIIPGINTGYITDADLEGFSKTELRLARNEVYARHGRSFEDDTLRQYFNACNWYDPILDPDEFDESVFNEYEKENINTIVRYEIEHGYR